MALFIGSAALKPWVEVATEPSSVMRNILFFFLGKIPLDLWKFG